MSLLTRRNGKKTPVKDLNVRLLSDETDNRFGIRNGVKNGLMDIVLCA
jgi:hypothetical protein